MTGKSMGTGALVGLVLCGSLVAVIEWHDRAVPRSSARLMSRVEPEYSTEAKIARINSLVTIETTINEAGVPEKFHVLKSSGFGLDESALKALQQWRFSPAKGRSGAVPVKASVSMPFFLWFDTPTADLSFHIPKGGVRPLLLSGSPLVMPSDDPHPTITFKVNTNGYVAGVSGGGAEIQTILRSWHFRPAVIDRTPIVAWGTLRLFRTS